MKCGITMEMDKDYAVCVLCCCSFLKNTLTASSNNCEHEHDKKLLDFCTLLDKCPSPRTIGQNNQPFVFVLNRSLEDLETCGLSVCSECSNFVEAALESQSRVEEMEGNVRRLQMELLNQLRELQNQMNVFRGEMGKIEGAIKSSDGGYLMTRISVGNEENGRGGASVLKARARAMDVVGDLRAYQSEACRKLSVTDNHDGAVSIDTYGGNPNSLPVVDETMETLYSNHQGIENVVKIEVNEEDTSIFYDEAEDSESSYYLETDGGIHDADISFMGDPGPGLAGTNNQQPSQRQGGLWPRSRIRESKLNRGYFDQQKLQLIEEMTAFKKMFVSRAYKREVNCNFEPDTMPPEGNLLLYDFEQEKFFVGNVEVILHEKEETISCSGCGLKGKPPEKGNNKRFHDLEKRMRDHIIGQHLGGFHCSLCEEVRTSRTMFLEHLREVHNGGIATGRPKNPHLPRPHKCTLCEYCTNKPCDLRRHLKVHEKRGELQEPSAGSRRRARNC